MYLREKKSYFISCRLDRKYFCLVWGFETWDDTVGPHPLKYIALNWFFIWIHNLKFIFSHIIKNP